MRSPIAAIAIAIAIVMDVRLPTNADTPQPDGPPDGGDHSWCYVSGFNEQTAADAAMTRLRQQTDVTTNYPGSCGANTDVRWTQGDLGGSFGRGGCIVTLNGTCDVYRITLAMGTINNTRRPVDQRSKTSCHELVTRSASGTTSTMPSRATPRLTAAFGQVRSRGLGPTSRSTATTAATSTST